MTPSFPLQIPHLVSPIPFNGQSVTDVGTLHTPEFKKSTPLRVEERWGENELLCKTI